MSYALTKAVRAWDVPLAQKAVGLALVSFAGTDRLAWPSVRKLAEAASVGERTAQRALRALVASGHLTVSGSVKSQRGSPVPIYRINDAPVAVAPPPKGVTAPPFNASERVSQRHPFGGRKGVRECAERVSERHPEEASELPEQKQQGSQHSAAFHDSPARRGAEPQITDPILPAPGKSTNPPPVENRPAHGDESWIGRAAALAASCGPGLADPAKVAGLTTTVAELERWRRMGADWALDVEPVVRGLTARSRASPVRSWTFFTGAIADAIARRAAPDPTPADRGPAHDPNDPRVDAKRHARRVALVRGALGPDAGRPGDGPADPLGGPARGDHAALAPALRLVVGGCG